MSTTRIYFVSNAVSGDQYLVRAASPASAIRHVARATFGVAVAAQETIVELLTAGVTVEDAGAEPNAKDLDPEVPVNETRSCESSEPLWPAPKVAA